MPSDSTQTDGRTFLASIVSRRSIRKFTAQPIPESVLRELIAAFTSRRNDCLF